MISAFSAHRFQRLRALHKDVLVVDMEFSERFTQGGIVLLNDNGKGTGIRPRWGKVYAVGPNAQDVEVGQWVCVAHGRWTRGVEIDDGDAVRTLRKIDPKDILLVSDEMPNDDTLSDAIHIDAKTR
jgi:co-chaperonin GroES (HSP10)